jgi:hypothetical protein
MKRGIPIFVVALALPTWMPAQLQPSAPPAGPAQGQPPKQPETKKTASTTTDEAKKARLAKEALMPSLSRSPTGYVEDAAVGSMVRVRFDAGFDTTTPDLAEFFYAKSGSYPHGPGLGPDIVTRLRFQEAHVDLEYKLARRFSMFVDAGGRSVQAQSGIVPVTSAIENPGYHHTGLGDLQAGFKCAILASPEGYLTFQFRAYFPTGDAHLGLGTGHYSIEPSLLFTRKVTREVAVSGQFSVWHPIDGSDALPLSSTQSFAGNVLTFGAGVGRWFTLAENLRVSPVVELVGWSIRSGYVTLISGGASAAGDNIVNAKLGARILVERHNSIYAGFGRQLSHVGWYRDFIRVDYTYVF